MGADGELVWKTLCCNPVKGEPAIVVDGLSHCTRDTLAEDEQPAGTVFALPLAVHCAADRAEMSVARLEGVEHGHPVRWFTRWRSIA